MLRPATGSGSNDAVITDAVFKGSNIFYSLAIGGETLNVVTPPPADGRTLASGDRVVLTFPKSKVILLGAERGNG